MLTFFEVCLFRLEGFDPATLLLHDLLLLQQLLLQVGDLRLALLVLR
jgi:hypothetical protein